MHKPSLRSLRRPRLVAAFAAAALLVGGLTAAQTGTFAQTGEPDDDGQQPVDTSTDAFGQLQSQLQDLLGQDILEDTTKILAGGKQYSLTNNLDTSLIPTDLLRELGLGDALVKLGLGGKDSGGTVPDDGVRREYLVVWAGDNNVLDRTGSDLTNLPAEITRGMIGQKDLIGPDFFAVVDATKGSSTYGEVVNTATVGPLVENEPHHMQYVWHKGHNIFAGGLFTDVTYVIDTSELPKLTLKSINMPTDTMCGSVPDAYWVTENGKAYGTYMGGPDVPGPCQYSDGSIRLGNGFGGSPGEVVRLDENGKTLWEAPATPAEGRDRAAVRQHPAAQRADLRQPARHPGPRGPRDAGDQRLQRAAQHHPQPDAVAVVVPPTADGPHLGHLRPGQAEAEGGLVPAGRSA